MKLYTKTIKQGDYSHGVVVKQDYSKATEYYNKCIEMSDTIGTKNLANLYYSGLGVKQDYTKANEWY